MTCCEADDATRAGFWEGYSGETRSAGTTLAPLKQRVALLEVVTRVDWAVTSLAAAIRLLDGTSQARADVLAYVRAEHARLAANLPSLLCDLGARVGAPALGRPAGEGAGTRLLPTLPHPIGPLLITLEGSTALVREAVASSLGRFLGGVQFQPDLAFRAWTLLAMEAGRGPGDTAGWEPREVRYLPLAAPPWARILRDCHDLVPQLHGRTLRRRMPEYAARPEAVRWVDGIFSRVRACGVPSVVEVAGVDPQPSRLVVRCHAGRVSPLSASPAEWLESPAFEVDPGVTPLRTVLFRCLEWLAGLADRPAVTTG